MQQDPVTDDEPDFVPLAVVTDAQGNVVGTRSGGNHVDSTLYRLVEPEARGRRRLDGVTPPPRRRP